MVNKFTEYFGNPDLSYLRDALARASIDSAPQSLTIESLLDGRTAASVERLTTDDGSYVLKRTSKDNWLPAAAECPGEGRLWLAGTLNRETLPQQIQCPIIDAIYHPPSEAWWLLMHDVSNGIAGRGKFGERETITLWSCVAQLHAAYWNEDEKLKHLPVASLAKTVSAFAEPLYSAITQEYRTPWAKHVAEEFMPLRVLLPIFLDLITPTQADLFLEMVKDRSWHNELDNSSATFLHGDLRRANISFQNNTTILFDWELATTGPAACDLQWNNFLTFWAYTPEDGKEPWDRDHLKELYVAELEKSLGYKINRKEFERTWGLAWVSVISQLGFVFADANLDDPGSVATLRKRIEVAFKKCKEALGA